jgi:AcrR family transcriptional regulator
MTQTSFRRHLPRGRHAAPREVVRDDQRSRLVDAMAAAVAEKGYDKVAVADVIARAGVSRKSFYELFENKEACFLATYDEGVEEQFTEIEAAMDAAGEDLFAVARAGTRRYLEVFAEHPDYARTCLVEGLSAGAPLLARRDATHARFAAMLARTHAGLRAVSPDVPDVPPHVFRAVVGAINELVTVEVAERGPEGLPALDEAVFELLLAMLLGYEQARALTSGGSN